MLVRDAMSQQVACCLPEDSAKAAAVVMRDENTGVVPIIDSPEKMHVVGVVTDRDLCMDVVAEGLNPAEVPLRQCMTESVVYCRPDEPVEQAVKLMSENQIRRIVVMEDDKSLRGILSLADLAWDPSSTGAGAGTVLREVSQPTPDPSRPRSQE